MSECVLNTVHVVRETLGLRRLLGRTGMLWTLNEGKEKQEGLGTALRGKRVEGGADFTAPSAQYRSRLLSSQLPRRHPFFSRVVTILT